MPTTIRSCVGVSDSSSRVALNETSCLDIWSHPQEASCVAAGDLGEGLLAELLTPRQCHIDRVREAAPAVRIVGGVHQDAVTQDRGHAVDGVRFFVELDPAE